MREKTLALMLMTVLFVFSVFNMNMIGVSAYDSPAIYIEPARTADETLTAGSTYTISIKTDYGGSDVWGWQFTLDFNPELLQGGLNTTDTWTGDGVNKTFTATVTTVVPDSEKVFLDLVFVAEIAQGTDMWTGDGSTTLFVTTGKPVHEDSEVVSMNFTDTWAGNGVTKTFNATRIPVTSGSEKVYLDGVLMSKPANYTINYDAGTITFVTAPDVGAEIKATYDGEMFRDTDFTIDYAAGAITFVTAPGAGVKVEATYMYGHYSINYQTGAITFRTAPGAGVEVKAVYLGDGIVNGDLITTAKHSSAQFLPGTFNNIEGKLSLSSAFFFYLFTPPYRTSGPGTLANVTFTVVGYNFSDIILGPDTELQGNDGVSLTTYTIIDGEATPNQLGHGYVSNLIPGDMVGDTIGSSPDGDVDWFDFGDFAAAYGSSVGQTNYNPLADLVGDTDGSPPDGDVDWFDFGVFAANYGRSI